MSFFSWVFYLNIWGSVIAIPINETRSAISKNARSETSSEAEEEIPLCSMFKKSWEVPLFCNYSVERIENMIAEKGLGPLNAENYRPTETDQFDASEFFRNLINMAENPAGESSPMREDLVEEGVKIPDNKIIKNKALGNEKFVSTDPSSSGPNSQETQKLSIINYISTKLLLLLLSLFIR